MKRLVFLFLLLSFSLLPTLALSAVIRDTDSDVTDARGAGMTMQKLVYSVVSEADGTFSFALPYSGLLNHVMVRVPATNPATTGYSLYLYQGTSATAYNFFTNSNATSLATTSDQYLRATNPNGQETLLPLAGKDVYYLKGADLGNAKALTIELWIWQ